MKVTNSRRLTYRLMDQRDKQLLFDLDQDPEVMRFINGGKVSSIAHVREVLIPRMLAYRNPQKGWGLWKIAKIDDGQYLGWVLVRPVNFFGQGKDENNLELGWRFFRNTWGNGYATEAAEQIKLAIKNQRVANKISAIAVTENKASIGVMKKLGMTFVKRYLHKDPLFEEEVDYYELEL